MLVADFEIITTKPFPTALMLSPFGCYGDIVINYFILRRSVAPWPASRAESRSQWSISTIICICTIGYEDYSIYSSVCVDYYVASSCISHI